MRDRAFRRAQRDRVIKNRKRLKKDTSYLDKNTDDQDNRYNKRHPYDCGKTDCMVCHPHKKNKACASKYKDEHGIIDEVVEKEILEDMCDFGD